jgi:hypothetical protein
MPDYRGQIRAQKHSRWIFKGEDEMKFRLIGLGCAGLLAFGLSFGSFAGSIADADNDGVPDQYDNCLNVPNGPLLGTGSCNAQEDSDGDGYGNACDGDLTQDGSVLGTDFGALLGYFPSVGLSVGDLNCDGSVLGTDFGVLLSLFPGAIKPSGLACADPTGATAPCTP